MRNITYIPKTIFITLTIIIYSNYSIAQNKRSGEIGITAGGSYMLGDINKIPFMETNFSGGAFFRHTIDTRLAIKSGLTYGKLTGSDSKYNNGYQQARNLSFSSNFYELSVSGEFNFIPYLPARRNYTYTPYIYAGIASAYYPGGGETVSGAGVYRHKFILTIPFGIGVKYNLDEDFILSAFMGMQKCFNDYLDFHYTPPSPHRPEKQLSYENNDDWFSVFGISLSYKIIYKVKCPAFD
jgi:hypothetical protein